MFLFRKASERDEQNSAPRFSDRPFVIHYDLNKVHYRCHSRASFTTSNFGLKEK